MRALFFCLFLSSSAFAACGGNTYLVNNSAAIGGGGQGAVITVQGDCTSSTASWTGDEVFLMASGTYNFTNAIYGAWNWNYSVTNGYHTIFRPQLGAVVTLVSSAPNGLFNPNGQGNLEFDGTGGTLTMSCFGSQANPCVGLASNGAGDAAPIFKNLTVTAFAGSAILGTPSGLTISGVFITGSGLSSSSGIYINGGCTSACTVANTTISNIGYGGLVATNAITSSNNVVWNVVQSNQACFWIMGTSTNDTGINCYFGAGPQNPTGNLVVRNGLFIGNKFNLLTDGGSTFDIYNTTTYGATMGGAELSMGNAWGSSGHHIENNVFCYTVSQGVYDPSSNAGHYVAMDYNNIVGCPGATGPWGTYNAGGIASLAAWRTATASSNLGTQDVHSISSNPQFRAAGGFAAQDYMVPPASPVNGAGVNISGITSDFFGNLIPSTGGSYPIGFFNLPTGPGTGSSVVQ